MFRQLPPAVNKNTCVLADRKSHSSKGKNNSCQLYRWTCSPISKLACLWLHIMLNSNKISYVPFYSLLMKCSVYFSLRISVFFYSKNYLWIDKHFCLLFVALPFKDKYHLFILCMYVCVCLWEGDSQKLPRKSEGHSQWCPTIWTVAHLLLRPWSSGDQHGHTLWCVKELASLVLSLLVL